MTMPQCPKGSTVTSTSATGEPFISRPHSDVSRGRKRGVAASKNLDARTSSPAFPGFSTPCSTTSLMASTRSLHTEVHKRDISGGLNAHTRAHLYVRGKNCTTSTQVCFYLLNKGKKQKGYWLWLCWLLRCLVLRR